MRVITYYTNDAYKALADKMTASAKAVGLVAQAYFYDNKDGSWMMGMNGKPSVILRAIEEHPKENIFFVDADCVFKSYPSLLNEDVHDHNAACVFNSPTKPTSTVIWFRKGTARRYAELWVEEMKRAPGQLDDYVALWRAFNRISPKRVLHLPPSYAWCEEFHRPRFGNGMAVIEHMAVGEHKTVDLTWGKSKNTIFKDDRG